jgi:hypothetical protein
MVGQVLKGSAQKSFSRIDMFWRFNALGSAIWACGRSCGTSSLPQIWLDLGGQVNLSLIDETPRPALVRLPGGHHGMMTMVKMLRGVAARRAIATTYVPAGQAQTQMHPARARLQALLTASRAGRHRFETDFMFTRHRGSPRKSDCRHSRPQLGKTSSRPVSQSRRRRETLRS